MDGTTSQLRRLREERRLSRMDVARETGLSTQTIADLENGARLNPRVDTVRALARMYRRSVGEVLAMIGPDSEAA